MFTLPTLPYSLNALEPYISEKSLTLHYEVLHQRYLDTVNETGPPDVDDLIDVIVEARQYTSKKLLHAALQAWNHEFFWTSMRVPTGVPGVSAGPLASLVERRYGSMGALREDFVEVGSSIFGAGWVWLTITPTRNLNVIPTTNADNPMFWPDRQIPILVCDVWEHSYYLDFGPERAHYLATWFDLLADFDFASQQTRKVLQAMAHGSL